MKAAAAFVFLVVAATAAWAALREDGQTLRDPAAPVPRSSFQPEGDGWTLIRTSFSVRIEHREILFTPLGPSKGRRFPRPARLELVTLTRGAVDLTEGSSVPAFLNGGALVVTRGPVIESHAGTDAGLETSWAFAARPAGEGDIIIRIRVHGEVVARVAGDGLHFFDPRREAGLDIRTPEWTDARGTKSAIIAACERGVIEVRLPSALVDASAYPATLAWRLRPDAAAARVAPGPRLSRPLRRAGGRAARE